MDISCDEYCSVFTEVVHIAEGVDCRYPVLLGEPYSEGYYSFQSTRVSRTVQSGLAFARGLFDDTGPVWGYQVQTIWYTLACVGLGVSGISYC